MYFDTHAHYDDKKYDEDRHALLASFKQNNISHVINIGCDIKSSLASIELAKKYDFVYASVGIHPHNAKDTNDEDYDTLYKLAKDSKVVAIGEIGLDYHYNFSPKEKQIEVFTNLLKISKNITMPVIIHSREACQDVFDTIKKSGVTKGVIHAYSGSLELAKEYIKLGFFIGVGGVVTFKNAKKLVDVVKNIPLENILLETDSPYLTPEPFRGTRNNSQNLKFVAQKISEIKQIDSTLVEDITLKNAQNLFCIK